MAKDDKKDKKNENSKDVKSNKKFVKDFKAELKKVSWPTPKQLVNNTTAVIVIVLITAIVVFILDVIFKTVNNYGIEGIKSIISSSDETNEDANINTSENESDNENTSESNGVQVTLDTVGEGVEDSIESVDNTIVESTNNGVETILDNNSAVEIVDDSNSNSENTVVQ